MEKVYLATRRFLRDEEGVTAIEYGLIAALVGVACVVALGLLGTGLQTLFNKVTGCLDGTC